MITAGWYEGNKAPLLLLNMTYSMVLYMQFVQTNLAEQINHRIVDAVGGYLKMEDVVNGTLFLTFLSSVCVCCQLFNLLAIIVCHRLYRYAQDFDE